MSKCERDRDFDLHIQDLLLIGDIVQKSGITVIKLHDARYMRRVERVAISCQTSHGLAVALHGNNDYTAADLFLTKLRAKYTFPLDEIVPEVEVLIERARQRAKARK